MIYGEGKKNLLTWQTLFNQAKMGNAVKNITLNIIYLLYIRYV